MIFSATKVCKGVDTLQHPKNTAKKPTNKPVHQNFIADSNDFKLFFLITLSIYHYKTRELQAPKQSLFQEIH